MVMIAVIKDSITENNLKKTSNEGKLLYIRFQKTYKISTSRRKRKTSDHLTISRIAATVFGMVIPILLKKPAYAKAFVGPFSATNLSR